MWESSTRTHHKHTSRDSKCCDNQNLCTSTYKIEEQQEQQEQTKSHEQTDRIQTERLQPTERLPQQTDYNKEIWKQYRKRIFYPLICILLFVKRQYKWRTNATN